MHRTIPTLLLLCGLVFCPHPAQAHRRHFPDVECAPNIDRENVDLVWVEQVKIDGQDCNRFCFVIRDQVRYVYAYRRHCEIDNDMADHTFTMSHLVLNRGIRDIYVFYNSRGCNLDRWIYTPPKSQRDHHRERGYDRHRRYTP